MTIQCSLNLESKFRDVEMIRESFADFREMGSRLGISMFYSGNDEELKTEVCFVKP